MMDIKDIFLERDIFPELLKWAEHSAKGLFLRGPRQTGKTRTLLELGKCKAFSGCLYIDLSVPEIKNWWDGMNGHLDWYARFRKYAEAYGVSFPDEGKPLVILDEIQESPRMFNSIRGIVNEQKVRVAATGSYLGIAEFQNRFSAIGQPFFYPAGDVEALQIDSLTYREVIRACERAKPDIPKESVFQYYFQYGGYPEVVKTWLETENYGTCLSILENIYSIIVGESQRYVIEPLPVMTWDMMFIGVAQQIEKKQDILRQYDQSLTYKFRAAGESAASRDNRISMMEWMLSCDLLWRGNVTNNLKDLGNIVKHAYYFADQGMMFLALSHSGQYPYLPIDSGNMSGMLAENFVALSLREYMTPLSYANKVDEIDFIYRKTSKEKPDSIEVKFGEGETKSSNKALDEGKIRRIVKIQGKAGPSTEAVIIYPMRDMDRFGEFLGFPQSHNRYTKTILDVFKSPI